MFTQRDARRLFDVVQPRRIRRHRPLRRCRPRRRGSRGGSWWRARLGSRLGSIGRRDGRRGGRRVRLGGRRAGNAQPQSKGQRVLYNGSRGTPGPSRPSTGSARCLPRPPYHLRRRLLRNRPLPNLPDSDPSPAASFGPSVAASKVNFGFGSLQAPTPTINATSGASANVTNFWRLDWIDMSPS